MKKIEFYTDDPQVMKDFPPKPISEDLPAWLEKIDNDNQFNVTHCAPVMDWMSGGYIMYNAWETLLNEKVVQFRKGVELETQNKRPNLRKINPTVYAGDCMPIDNGPYSYFRLETDFKVVTPPGYSCLVMQPYYDFNSKFTVMPGIIDTDKYDWVITAMAYTKEKTLRIYPGEKLLQIIPFKRDDWQMELKEQRMYSQLFHYIKGVYKKLFRSKKVYK
tara:strand:+ start:87 stop:740 length:654 start_codon:yes stop_codon:yes gene_type:complete